jgi:hypothetical protein
MALTLDERWRWCFLVADQFNARHPERNPITERSGEAGEEI